MGKIIFTLIFILIFPVLLLFLSGDWFWVEGWIFSLWFTGLCFTTIIYLYHKDPALLAERYKRPGTANHKKWDQVIVYGLQIGFIAWIVFMPLDAKRFRWTTPFSIWLKILGGIGLLLSFLLFFRAYADNTFVSPLLEYRESESNKSFRQGVYGFVRHPMYLGGILLFIGTPLLLGSLYGIIIGVLMLFLLVVRIIGEEKC